MANINGLDPADLASKLCSAFDSFVQKNYGEYRVPPPIVTKFDVAPIDALLGGGIVSSGPVILSSTPETGKSTFAFQFSKNFQKEHPNSVVVYIDIEGSGNSEKENDEAVKYRVSRIESFGIDTSRFRYEPVVLDVMKLFEMIEQLVEIKKVLEQKIGMEFHVLFIVDSISAVPSSKTEDAIDPNKIIGVCLSLAPFMWIAGTSLEIF